MEFSSLSLSLSLYLSPVVQVKELEGEIHELTAKIRDVERTNTSLHNKVSLM